MGRWVSLQARAASRRGAGGERLPGDGPEPWLSYADLAVAVVDEIEQPVRHRTRVSVFNSREEEG
ncbi:hypothetical protein [Streptomyces sp. NPDC052721]|uniref:hypothetical protein n=1 Tax=Streptomyces sp. NPDC052721 TaxID=3154955 RepID=UPI0034328306